MSRAAKRLKTVEPTPDESLAGKRANYVRFDDRMLRKTYLELLNLTLSKLVHTSVTMWSGDVRAARPPSLGSCPPTLAPRPSDPQCRVMMRCRARVACTPPPSPFFRHSSAHAPRRRASLLPSRAAADQRAGRRPQHARRRQGRLVGATLPDDGD
eukprot:7386095-Prymnesium_polylepis.1